MGRGFVGPLDAYTSTLLDAWFTRRVLASYTGPLIRIRVDRTGQPEQDIYAVADGNADTAAIATFVGADAWYVTKFYGQMGIANIIQTSAANQPQGAIDSNGLVYAYAAPAGFTSIGMLATGLSVNLTDSTSLSVCASAGYALDAVTMRDSGLTERRILNYSGSIQNYLSGTGTNANLAGTNTNLYSLVQQVGAGGNRITNGLATATGTKTSAAMTVVYVMIGQGGGGYSWSQNSKVYGEAVWKSDLGNTDANAIQAAFKALFLTQ